jgi:hypothetical protein
MTDYATLMLSDGDKPRDLLYYKRHFFTKRTVCDSNSCMFLDVLSFSELGMTHPNLQPCSESVGG